MAWKLKSCHRELVFLALKMWGVKKSDCTTQLLLIKKSRDFNERGHENTRINFVWSSWQQKAAVGKKDCEFLKYISLSNIAAENHEWANWEFTKKSLEWMKRERTYMYPLCDSRRKPQCENLMMFLPLRFYVKYFLDTLRLLEEMVLRKISMRRKSSKFHTLDG